MRKIIAHKNDWVIFLIVFLLFQDVFSGYSSGFLSLLFSYVDEIIALGAAVYIIIYLIVNKSLPQKGKRPAVMMLLVILLGFAVGLINGYQENIVLLNDALLCSKFYICFYVFDNYFDQNQNRTHTISVATFGAWCRIIAVMLFLLMAGNYILKIFPTEEIRYGIASQKLFFSHMTVLAATGVCLIAGIILSKNIQPGAMPFFVLAGIVVASTLRAKALAWCGLAVLLFFSTFYIRFKQKSFIATLVAIAVLWIGYGQLEFYFLNGLSSTSRGIMLTDAIRIANESIVGRGLASFGSYMSKVHYSPVYLELGYTKIWGLSPNYSSFLCDNFLATVLGQFGWIGACIILAYFIYLYWRCRKIYDNKENYIASLLIVSYLVITSFGETSIYNSYAVVFAIILAIALNIKQKEM